MSTLANSDLFIVQRPDGGNAGTYKIEWESILDNIAASPAVQFQGTANFTSGADDPASKLDPPGNLDGTVVGRQNGDLWVNTTAGTFAWANPGEANKAVVVGDYCIWDADDGVWRFIGSVGGDVAPVTSVDANAPLSMVDSATTGAVVIESSAASTTTAGHVARLATSADVEKDSTVSDRSSAVVTADLLQATNVALEAATAGGVTDVNGVNPKADDIPDNWKDEDSAAVDISTYINPDNGEAKPAINVYDEASNVKDVYVKFATEGQVGVSYIAEAGTGAIMDFSNAENHADGLGANLDNFGMMTTRRTYNNFVPRNFELLNLLP